MNSSFLKITWKGGLSFLFGLAVFLFWGAAYPAHVAYHEQFQLFLFDAAYWWERVAIPGGVADYLAEFLTQFFYYPWAGACIIALLLVAMQRLVWQLARRAATSSPCHPVTSTPCHLDTYYPLTFLPPLLLWHYMGDENAMLALAVALIISLIAACHYVELRGKLERTLHIVFLVPLLYWAIGPAHLVFTGYVIVREFMLSIRNHNIWGGIGIAIAAGLWGGCCPLIAGMWLQYPVPRLVQGIGYHRFPIAVPWEVPLLAGLLVALPYVLAALPRATRCKPVLWVAVQMLVVSLFGWWIVAEGCDMDKEEALEYDQLIRQKRWEAVVAKAERKSPTSPFGVTCLNLALGKTGQLADRMFEFYQNGSQGLLPEFQRDFTSPLPTSEVFYHLGMVNTSQRFAFEAMEAIPNYRKSGRCFKRLAETNLINGQYAVAAKYLRTLQKTLFYDDWATETLTYLYDEARINAHPEWGWLRQIRLTEDFLFSDRETDIMLALLFQHNYKNRMAFEYMLAYVMLRRDIARFMKLYPLGQHADYSYIPRSYQEALAYHWVTTHKDFNGLPWSLAPATLRNIEEFAKAYKPKNNNIGQLSSRFGNTYWYYLFKNN